MRKNMHVVIVVLAIVLVFAVWAFKSALQPVVDEPASTGVSEENSIDPGEAEETMAAVQAQIEHLQELEKDNPDDPDVLIALGNVYYDAGLARQAIEYYDRVLVIKPDNVDVLVDKATMLRLLKQPDEAVKQLEQAVMIAPEHEQAWFNLGVICSGDLNDPASAIAAWKKFLEINPNATHADAVRGEIERMEKELGEL